jgi:hypothetical protein
MEAKDVLSILALFISLNSAFLAWRAERRAKEADRRALESVRPFVTTGVHLLPNDMSVSLANYGVGLAIVTQVALRRNDGQPTTSLANLMPFSADCRIEQAIDFVQSEYYLRPGDCLPLASAAAAHAKKADAALKHWEESLRGIAIEVTYRDIFGRPFTYSRKFLENA